MFTFTVKHVPEWFPGAGFKKFARMAKEDLDDSINLPFLGVRETFQVRHPHLSSMNLTGTNSRQMQSPPLQLWRRV
jgi:hypothetical protein